MKISVRVTEFNLPHPTSPSLSQRFHPTRFTLFPFQAISSLSLLLQQFWRWLRKEEKECLKENHIQWADWSLFKPKPFDYINKRELWWFKFPTEKISIWPLLFDQCTLSFHRSLHRHTAIHILFAGLSKERKRAKIKPNELPVPESTNFSLYKNSYASDYRQGSFQKKGI